MGSVIEFNDTLKIKTKDIPNDLVVGQEYSFKLHDRRIFHLHPIRVFLVEEINEKWNYLGHAQVLEITINAKDNKTCGKLSVAKLYDKEYIAVVNKNEPPSGKGHIEED